MRKHHDLHYRFISDFAVFLISKQLRPSIWQRGPTVDSCTGTEIAPVSSLHPSHLFLAILTRPHIKNFRHSYSIPMAAENL